MRIEKSGLIVLCMASGEMVSFRDGAAVSAVTRIGAASPTRQSKGLE